MAIEEQTARTVFKGDGSTRAFPVTWYLDAEENVIVKMTNVTTAQVKTLVLGTDYTVTPSDDEYPTNGAVINYPKNRVTPALGSDYRLTVIRNVPYTQSFVFPNNTRLLPKNIEGGLDGLELQIQQINDKADNAINIPAGMDYNNDEFVAELFDKAKLAEQSAINAKASEINAKASEINAKSSATSVSQSAQTATTKASEAGASATSAKTSETNANSYKEQASLSAQTATTKANEASSSATNANQSATSAKTSEISASQSAQTATTKAQEASSSATNAKSSATSAKESEDKAQEYAKRAENASSSVGNPVSNVTVDNNIITVTKGVGGSAYYTVDNVDNATHATTAGTADSATKATQDGSGNTITTHYLSRNQSTQNDMNACTVEGIYRFNGTLSNAWTGVSRGTLLVFNNKYNGGSGVGGTYLVQMAFPTYGKIYMRRRVNTEAWTDWVALVFTSDIVSTPATDDNSTKIASTAFVKNQKYLQRKNTVNAQGLDFNSYTVDGMYNYGGTFTNSYSNRSVFGTLVVLNNLYNGGSGTTGTYISQTAHDADGDIYARYRNGTGNWSAWRKFFKEPTRTVLMNMWIGEGDIKLSESWRNFDELVFAGTNDNRENLDFKYIKTADLANWLADSSYPPTLQVVAGMWVIQRQGTTDTLLKTHFENIGMAKVIGIKY